jgi:hypothetical protein
MPFIMMVSKYISQRAMPEHAWLQGEATAWISPIGERRLMNWMCRSFALSASAQRQRARSGNSSVQRSCQSMSRDGSRQYLTLSVLRTQGRWMMLNCCMCTSESSM